MLEDDVNTLISVAKIENKTTNEVYTFTDTALRVYLYMRINSENGVCHQSWNQIATGIGKTKELFKGKSKNKPDEILKGIGFIKLEEGVGQKKNKLVFRPEDSEFDLVFYRDDIDSGGNINKRGLYLNKLCEKDYMYILDIEGADYFKVGRTFYPDKRLKENTSRIKKVLGEDTKVTQIGLYSGTHSVVYSTEQMLVGMNDSCIFKNYRPKEHYGSSELLLNSKLNEVIEILDSSLEKEN